MVVALAALLMFQECETKRTTARAVRAPRAPTIDGREDDEVWRMAAPITEFQEFDPNEGKAPRYRTEARVTYDAPNFYVFVRAFRASSISSSSIHRTTPSW